MKIAAILASKGDFVATVAPDAQCTRYWRPSPNTRSAR